MGSNFRGSGGKLTHYQFNLGDPHCKIIGMCIYDAASASNEIGRFLVPGAVVKSLPTPANESLVPPQQDGELTFQMISLVTGLRAEPFRFGWDSNSPVFTRATFHITKNNTPASEWEPATVRITDANGKSAPARIGFGRGREGDDAVMDFQGFLDPAKGPYKIRAEFVHHSGFSSNELVTFTNVPFPANSESLTLSNKTAEVSGHQLTLEKFYGTFSERPKLNFNSIQPVIQARIDPADGTTHSQMLSAVDDNQEELQRWGMQPTTTGETYFSFGPNTHAKSVTLTFAVHKSRFVEFEMMPMVISTNEIVKR